MSVQSLLTEPGRVNEPLVVEGYSDVLSQVATDGKPVIVCRNGADLAAVIPLEHLQLLREALARREVEKRAEQIDWHRLPKTHCPPQQWYDDSDNPFEPAEEPQS
jgi:prevent-host-death family protein